MASTLYQIYWALDTFYKTMGEPTLMKTIPKIRVRASFPTVLTLTETQLLIDSIKNIKHKAAVALCYCGGLRVSELIKLTPADIDTENMRILVRDSKGGVDRYTLLSHKALAILQQYKASHYTETWLFWGRKAHWCKRNLELIVTNYSRKVKIPKRVHPHTLRHSCATHLLEAGVSLQIIQGFLGHKSISSTILYTHISSTMEKKVISPLDIKIVQGGNHE